MKQILVLGAALFSAFASFSQIKPMHLGKKYAFQYKGMYFEVNPEKGGRISSFLLNGKEALYVDTSKQNNNWGSTFWPAPQSKWGWPPSDTLDSRPYMVEVLPTSLKITSHTTTSKPNLAFSKLFSVNEADTSVVVTYSMYNSASSVAHWGPWQIARVPSGGLSFFPKGESALTGDLAPLMKDSNSVIWFEYDSTRIPKGVPKLFSDGKEGWLAHVDDTGLLTVFKFYDTPPTQKSEGEEEIEFYCHPELHYVELEPLGPNKALHPGAHAEWTVKWYIRQLPDNMNRKVGSVELLQYVRHLVRIRPHK